MTLGMQGSWTVSVKQKSASWIQRFRIQGSSNGVDGVYNGNTTTPPVFVSGTQWGITVEHNPPGSTPWTISRFRIGNFKVTGGQFSFDIESDDTAGDADFNDLVLTCSMTLANSEYVIYGNVKTYSGTCLFNPCYPSIYYVIDDIYQLQQLLKYEPARRVIEKYYSRPVKKALRHPFPEPDPSPFRPMMIPSGLSDEPGLVVESAKSIEKDIKAKAVDTKDKRSAKLTETNIEQINLVSQRSMVSAEVDRSDLLEIGKIAGTSLRPCEVKPLSETLLRFLEYDRTDSEKLGSPYTGEGSRFELGLASTDEFGTFVFRFSQSISQLVEEINDVSVGEDVSVQIRPDIIVQIMNGLPDVIAFETAPYYNITNVKHISICIPEYTLPRPHPACQGGRAFQAIGNLFIVPNPWTTLHLDGTVSNTSSTGPKVDHAAWYGTLDLFACFVDLEPAVKYYTIRYKREGDNDWSFVNEYYAHLKKQPNGSYDYSKVGPTDRTINGKTLLNAYENIENDSQWLLTHRDRKLQLHTNIYQNVAGAVSLMIEGYDKDGNKVMFDGYDEQGNKHIASGYDIIKLYIDNHFSEGEIDAVRLGTIDPGECALIDLPDAGSALTIKYRATDVEGFMANYAINVYRGSNTLVPIKDTATGNPVLHQYQSTLPYRFRGTLDETLNSDGYVEIQVEPVASAWLPAEIMFCAFSFELSALDRLTNGYGVPPSRTLWRELIGITYSPPTTQPQTPSP